MAYFFHPETEIVTPKTFKFGVVEVHGPNELGIYSVGEKPRDLVFSLRDNAVRMLNDTRFHNIMGKPLYNFRLLELLNECSQFEFSHWTSRTGPYENDLIFDNFFEKHNICFSSTHTRLNGTSNCAIIPTRDVEEVADKFIEWMDKPAKEIIEELQVQRHVTPYACYASVLVEKVYG